MKQLSAKARRLLELTRYQEPPDAAVQSRVEVALAARIASGAAAGGDGVPLAKSLAGSGLGMSAPKAVLVASVVGAVVAAGWLAGRSSGSGGRPGPERTTEMPTQRIDREPPSPAVVPPPASPSEGVQLPGPERTSVLHRPSSMIRRRTATQTFLRADGIESVPAEAPAPSDHLGAETAALLSTQRALRDGNTRLALALLDEQDATYGTGALQEERAAARVLALCQSGLVEEARAEADRFERRWPRSALLGRIRSACRKP
jgi:hypothetical protein